MCDKSWFVKEIKLRKRFSLRRIIKERERDRERERERERERSGERENGKGGVWILT